MPIADQRVRVSGSRRMRAISSFSLASTGCGTPAGASRPNHSSDE